MKLTINIIYRPIIILLAVIIFGARPTGAQTESSSATAAKDKKTIYLTFDADMTPHMENELRSGKVKEWYDPKIISYLEDQKIPATIFVTGLFARLYPKEIKQWSDNGLLIENHTYDHGAFEAPCFGLDVLKSDKDKVAEIKKTQDILFKLTGKMPK